jgi:hypothetical protein
VDEYNIQNGKWFYDSRNPPQVPSWRGIFAFLLREILFPLGSGYWLFLLDFHFPHWMGIFALLLRGILFPLGSGWLFLLDFHFPLWRGIFAFLLKEILFPLGSGCWLFLLDFHFPHLDVGYLPFYCERFFSHLDRGVGFSYWTFISPIWMWDIYLFIARDSFPTWIGVLAFLIGLSFPPFGVGYLPFYCERFFSHLDRGVGFSYWTFISPFGGGLRGRI